MKKPTPFGKYYLLERINTGGMAEVFRAKAFGVEGFERLVAVKRILSNVAEDKEFIRMFIEEAKLSVQLNHANIAQIFDLGVVEGSYYIALEHVHGRDLRVLFERCRQLGEAMSVAQACFIAMKVCEGLDYAHNKRDQAGRELALIHRDVSPQNVLVSFEGEVKLIDFGIAKAAGPGGPNTQSGILKGKFGYMSPEQVRGQDLDRRSDVFSCGVVLYELLTGERLFVGDSDFSTLEKVRNVEILPPSTYNRKIPDELERIVLKALSKDAEERYQNAIDLHDELQAFVYTAGEFYSRKDLAAWMKKTFGKEIEEETAKLESYRQLKPPPPAAGLAAPVTSSSGSSGPVPVAAPGPASGGLSAAASVSASNHAPIAAPQVSGSGAIGGASGAVSGVADGIPEPARNPQSQSGKLPARKQPTQPVSVSVPVAKPARSTREVAAVKPPPPPASRSQPLPVAVIPPSRSQPITSPPSSAVPVPSSASSSSGSMSAQPPAAMAAGPRPAPAGGQRYQRPVDMGWEDDELETRVYDGDDPRHKSKSSQLPLQPPVSSSPGIALPTDAELGGAAGAGAAWPSDAAPTTAFPLAPPMSPSLGLSSGSSLGSSLGSSSGGSGGYHNGALAPGSFPVGSNEIGTPLPELDRVDLGALSGPSSRRDPGATYGASDLPTIPVSSFGARMMGNRRPRNPASNRTAALIGAGIGAIALIAAIVWSTSGKPRPPAPAPAPAPTPTAVVQPPAPPAADPNTGFDLYVSPPGISLWKLDGESRTDRLPSRIRGIAPGAHTVQIEPPPGFLSQLQHVAVELGKAPKVEIVLQPIPGISGVFDSAPPGATVSLIIDGKRQTIGPSPARAPLDPRSAYQVLFEKPGYVSVNRPISFTGALEERVVVNLEKVAAPPPPPSPPPRAAPSPEPRRRASRPAPDTAPAAESPSASDDGAAESRGGKQGVLVLGSKPPCDISIDGNPTGLHTPQKEIKLPVGRHRVTLTNSEFGISESFNVDIKADAPERLIKDYSDRLPGDR